MAGHGHAPAAPHAPRGTHHTMAGGAHSISASRDERRPKRKHLRHMRLSRATNGGFHVQHEYMPGGDTPEPDTEHVFGKDEGAKLLDHVRRHLRISPAAGAASGADAEGAPAADEEAGEPAGQSESAEGE